MENGNIVIQGSLKTPCNFCGTPAPSNADGLLGTGICFSQACKDRMAADAAASNALKTAQASAITALNQPSTSGTLSTSVIVIIVISVLLLIVGLIVYLKMRK